ncbi:2-phospho-L-lactate transferase [Candidatus Bathyarchaeota archaeon]|nr:2-phospho-L-lactate transferase [Candidatus Bathyarchaeota archaeon]
MIAVLAGGVGGAKFLEGLVRVLDGERLTVIGNIGDDLDVMGLHVSPDLDTLMYMLAGLFDEERGWGIKGDSFNFLSMIERYGQEVWFRIGDKDLATHIMRSQLQAEGLTLTEVTRRLCKRLGVEVLLLPATDDPVRTKVDTEEGLLSFQEYFVKRRFESKVRGVIFEGSESARPSPEVLQALKEARGIVLAPSNPVVSIGCILSIPGIKQAMVESEARKVAVSPLIAGRAVRGPADRMLMGLGVEPTVAGVASLYEGLIDTFIIGKEDIQLTEAIRRLGMDAVVEEILMSTLESRMKLAAAVLRALEA